MASAPLRSALRQLHPLAGAGDHELLERYCAGRDEAAFAQLLRRHGPMVLGVGRRVLCREEAEDVFQATFLLLARKAAGIRKRESVGSWLHGVAYHLALKARAREARRRDRERQAAQMRKTATVESAWQDLQEVLDRALHGLPEHHRAVLLLCYLEGKTQEEAARQLGCPLGTVRSRLARGRKSLQDALARRGLALSAAALATALAANSAAALPAGLLRSTLPAALRFAAKGQAAGLVSAGAATLADAGLRTMFTSKAKAVTALVLVLALFGGGLGALAEQAGNAPEAPAQPTREPQPAVAVADDTAAGPRTDRYGDPLPPGAVARLGSLRLFHGDAVHQVVLSPDGKLVVSVAGTGTRLWDATTGRALALDQRFLTGATFFPAGGKLLAVASDKETGLGLWDLASGKEVARLPWKAAHQPWAVSPDGKIFAFYTLTRAGDRPGSALQFFDVATGKVSAPLDLGGNELRDLLYSADGTTLVARDRKHTVHVWDAAGRTPRPSSLASADEFDGVVALSADGKTLATAPGRGERVRLWDVPTFQELPALDGQPKAFINSLSFSPDGKLLAATCGDATLRLWDLAARKEARQFRGKDGLFYCTAFSGDGKTLVGGDRRCVMLWDVATGRPHHDFGHTYTVDALSFSPDGKRLATGAIYSDSTIRVWDPLTGREAGRLLGHASAGITALAHSPDGKLLASCGQDETVRLWDAASGREVRRLDTNDHPAYRVAFAPDGKTVATTGRRKAVHLWDVATGRELRSFANPGELVLMLAFSPDGRLIATKGMKEDFVRLWDVAAGKELRRLPVGVARRSGPLAFSPDGTELAAGDDDGAVHVWHVPTGEKRRTFAPLGGPVFCLAFSPDGRSLAGGYESGLVQVWETATGLERWRSRGHGAGEAVMSVAFSPDGALLASGGTDRIVLVWDVTGRLTGNWPQPADLTPERLGGLWDELRDGDAAKAYRAELALFAAGERAVALLKGRLRPAAAVDPKRVDRLIADLDSDEFAVREKAAKELEATADGAEPALRKVLGGTPSADVRRRAEALLEKLDPARSPERLRGLRALEILEHVGTDGAKKVLQELAKGAPEVWLTREAKAVLERLDRRPRP